VISVCWQDWRDIREKIAVAVNKVCHYVGLRKQHFGYHNSWRCWYIILLYVLGIVLCWCWQCLLTVGGNLLLRTVTTLDFTTVAWRCRRTLDITHCRKSSKCSANITVTVDSKCLHYPTLHRKFLQSVYCILVSCPVTLKAV